MITLEYKMESVVLCCVRIYVIQTAFLIYISFKSYAIVKDVTAKRMLKSVTWFLINYYIVTADY